jgi:hypothetical protein
LEEVGDQTEGAREYRAHLVGDQDYLDGNDEEVEARHQGGEPL